MINWYSLGFGSLWILGLGLCGASFSFAYYLAGHEKRRLKQVLEMPTFRIISNLGLLSICLGLAGAAAVVWERIILIGLALIIALHTWLNRQKGII